jgi:ABC-type transporter Mla subunit MlaD
VAIAGQAEQQKAVEDLVVLQGTTNTRLETIIEATKKAGPIVNEVRQQLESLNGTLGAASSRLTELTEVVQKMEPNVERTERSTRCLVDLENVRAARGGGDRLYGLFIAMGPCGVPAPRHRVASAGVNPHADGGADRP